MYPLTNWNTLPVGNILRSPWLRRLRILSRIPWSNNPIQSVPPPFLLPSSSPLPFPPGEKKKKTFQPPNPKKNTYFYPIILTTYK